MRGVLAGGGGAVSATWDVKVGDALAVLPTLEAGSVQCVVTSPPYWGLRDYGLPPTTWPDGWSGCLGLEPTPAAFITHLVDVFREVRRVLRPDGVVWVNMGDSYADKQRQMMPARVALALQADGWWLRSEVVWAKPNPMPASVTDRPTDAHEMLYMLSKRARYFYDADAVREKAKYGRRDWQGEVLASAGGGRASSTTKGADPSAGRNRRTVWSIPTQPFRGAHFATYPEALVKPCILAGTSEKGACVECGAPWRRVVSKEAASKPTYKASAGEELTKGRNRNVTRMGDGYDAITTLGWEPTCEHKGAGVKPCLVLDPFCGSGTTGAVALKNGCSFVGVEPSPDYAQLARKRIGKACPSLFSRELS